jgi:hypothetical protein
MVERIIMTIPEAACTVANDGVYLNEIDAVGQLYGECDISLSSHLKASNNQQSL